LVVEGLYSLVSLNNVGHVTGTGDDEYDNEQNADDVRDAADELCVLLDVERGTFAPPTPIHEHMQLEPLYQAPSPDIGEPQKFRIECRPATEGTRHNKPGDEHSVVRELWTDTDVNENDEMVLNISDPTKVTSTIPRIAPIPPTPKYKSELSLPPITHLAQRPTSVTSSSTLSSLSDLTESEEDETKPDADATIRSPPRKRARQTVCESVGSR
jgi:hypothetical protein